MTKKKRLGQHFLISGTVAKKIIDSACTKNKTVLEIGTGKGILTPLLCQNAKKVISVETDKSLYDLAKEKFCKISNLELIHADGFRTDENFDVFVSNLPYSQSRKAIEWLIQKRYLHAVIMVQREFADKLLASGKERSAVSVLASHAAKIETILQVNKNNFIPKPKVDSVVLKITRKKTVPKELILAVNSLFSQRRKKLRSILKKYNLDIDHDKRVDELPGDEIIKIAKKIIR